MAQYPIDIKIDTGNADRELKNVNDQLDQTEKATTGAAKGANKLSTDTQQLIKALQSLSKQEQQAASVTRVLTDVSKNLVNTQNQSITSTNRLKQAQDASSAQLKANTQALISLKSSIDQTNASLAKFNSTQNKTNESTKKVTEGTKKTSGALDTLITGAKAFVGLQVAGTAYEWGKAFVDTATKVELLQSRISLYTATSVESQQIFAQLVQQANRAGTNIDAAASSFQRFAAAGKDAGISNQVILQFTDNLQKMARVSGASSAEASAAIYQLSRTGTR